MDEHPGCEEKVSMVYALGHRRSLACCVPTFLGMNEYTVLRVRSATDVRIISLHNGDGVAHKTKIRFARARVREIFYIKTYIPTYLHIYKFIIKKLDGCRLWCRLGKKV